MKIAEFFALITLKGGKESVQTMKGLVNASIGAKVALIGAATALYQMSDAARKSAVFMDMYQLNTGLSAEQLQKLSFGASQAGVSMRELGQTIQALQQKNAMARLGYGWDPVLTRFGLTPGQDPVTQLHKIGNAIRELQGKNPAEARALAAKAGISDTMYYAMLRGTTEQMNKQLIVTNKEQQTLVKLNQEWGKFWFYMKQITVKIQALTAVFQRGLVKVLTRAVQGFYELFSRIYRVIEASDKLKKAIMAVGVALMAAFAPELLVLGGIILALDDIFGYFNGEDSVTGRILEWVNQSQEFKDIWEGVKIVFDAVSLACIELTDYFNGFREVLNDISNFFEKHEWLKKLVDLTNPIGFAKTNLGLLGSNKDMVRPALDTWRNNLTQNNNTNVYIEGTGNAAQDANNAMDARRAVVQANAQQGNLSEGSVNGGSRYGGKKLARA